jgi:hypothetical protein
MVPVFCPTACVCDEHDSPIRHVPIAELGIGVATTLTDVATLTLEMAGNDGTDTRGRDGGRRWQLSYLIMGMK